MEIKITHLRRCDLISLTGRFDSSTAPDLESALRASMEAGIHQLVIEMEGVEYFGSAAIRALVMAYKECRHLNRGDVRLVKVPEHICHVLSLAGILPLIQTFDDAVLAVGSF
jgi:anti-sigma B factor antagonist